MYLCETEQSLSLGVIHGLSPFHPTDNLQHFCQFRLQFCKVKSKFF